MTSDNFDLQHFFKNQSLLNNALVHRSYLHENKHLKDSNERLEFLGDSVLSLVISERLFSLLPNHKEGELTFKRSQLVQTSSLAQKALEIGLDQKILLSKGEEDSGGRNNPSLLSDTFEAILGAMYLDSGIDTCKKFLQEIFPDSTLTDLTDIKDPKSLLQEKTQSQGLGAPMYRLVDSKGPDHAKEFTVEVIINGQKMGDGTGTSKQRAESQAAENVLKSMH